MHKWRRGAVIKCRRTAWHERRTVISTDWTWKAPADHIGKRAHGKWLPSAWEPTAATQSSTRMPGLHAHSLRLSFPVLLSPVKSCISHATPNFATHFPREDILLMKTKSTVIGSIQLAIFLYLSPVSFFTIQKSCQEINQNPSPVGYKYFLSH